MLTHLLVYNAHNELISPFLSYLFGYNYSFPLAAVPGLLCTIQFDTAREIVDQFCGHEVVILWLDFFSDTVSSCCHGHSIRTCGKSSELPLHTESLLCSFINQSPAVWGSLELNCLTWLWTPPLSRWRLLRQSSSLLNISCVCTLVIASLYVQSPFSCCAFIMFFSLHIFSLDPPLSLSILFFSLPSLVQPHLPCLIHSLFSLSPIWPTQNPLITPSTCFSSTHTHNKWMINMLSPCRGWGVVNG